MSVSGSWNCVQCSFSNHPDLQYCEICEYPAEAISEGNVTRKSESSSSHIITLLDSPCGDNTSNHHNFLSNERTLSTKEVDDLGCAHAVPGILELIRQSMTAVALARSKVRYEYVVSSPPCLHVSQKGAYGSAWSCGYRNIQMLCSSLMQIEEYRTVLFDGSGVVPEINGIQMWIETAWKAGFDVEGAQQLNHRLLGYSKWIGATECAALLRYFGIRAVIVDFPEGVAIKADQPAAAIVTGKRPFESISPDHTRESSAASGSSMEGNNSGMHRVLTISDRIVRWVERYYQQTASHGAVSVSHATTSASDDYFRDTFLPPVYCQHQGHSRTIVGLQYTLSANTLTAKKPINNNGGSGSASGSASSVLNVGTNSSNSDTSCSTDRKLEQLLVFNPSSDANLALDSLLQGTLRWRSQLCKNLTSFQKDNYQLVYVAPGIMTETERLRSRVLSSNNVQIVSANVTTDTKRCVDITEVVLSYTVDWVHMPELKFSHTTFEMNYPNNRRVTKGDNYEVSELGTEEIYFQNVGQVLVNYES